MLEVRNLYKDYVPQCNSIEDMIAETKRGTWIKIVNNIRVSFGCTLQQTMDLLEIPAEERQLILEKLQADANEIEDGNNLIAAEKVHKDCVDNGGESTPAYRDEEYANGCDPPQREKGPIIKNSMCQPSHQLRSLGHSLRPPRARLDRLQAKRALPFQPFNR